MRKRNVVLGCLTSLAAGALSLAVRTAKPVRAAESPSESSRTHLSANGVPVVVELFTSEGCSSCPPADDVLAALERTQPVPGAEVVPLAFHVDYWDDLGWPDPFASPSFTSRQGTYAVRGRMYTPQAVVDGRTELVGSNATGLQRAIEQAAQHTHTAVQIAVRSSGDVLEAHVHVGQLPTSPGGVSSNDVMVFVALTQARAAIAVGYGENAGKSLHHTAIVRQLERAGATAPSGGDVRVNLRMPSGVPSTELRVVAFVQRVADHQIVGSATNALRRRPSASSRQ
jgi:hypothetical protein